MKDPGFYSFPKSSPDEWIQRVTRDLKGKDFDQALISELWGKIKIDPMYFAEGGASSQTSFHPEIDLPGFSPRRWTNVVQIQVDDEKQANAEILRVLNAGADGILLELNGSPDFSLLLSDVFLEYIELYIHCSESLREVHFALQRYLQQSDVQAEKLQGGILWSPTSAALQRGDVELDLPLAVEFLQSYGDLPHFRPLTLNWAQYADSGATGLQELSLGLAELIELMDRLTEQSSFTSELIFRNIGFYMSAGSDYFAEIAKLKAGRSLIAGLASLYSLTWASEQVPVLVATSRFTKSLIDPDTNLIRQTFEAMSGILGGANALLVEPFGKGELNKRVARNVSSILKDESHLDKFMDPAAGAYFLDQLQGRLESEVKLEVQRLEAAGGWYTSFAKGQFQSEIRKERESAQNAILTKERIKVGVNKYTGESLSKEGSDFELIEEKELQLKPSRASYLLEKERFAK